MRIDKRRMFVLDLYQALVASVLVLWLNGGIYELLSIPSAAMYILFFSFVIIAQIRNKDYIHNVIRSSYMLIPVLLIAIIASSVSDTQYPLILLNFARYSLIAIALYKYFRAERRFAIIPLAVFLLDTTFITVRTIYYLSINPMISRYLATSEYAEMIPAVGGYDFVYGLPIIILFMVDQLRKKRRVFFNLIFILLFIFCLVYSHYMIADLLLLLSLVFYIVVVLCEKYKKKRWLIVGAAILILFAIIAGLIVVLSEGGLAYSMIQIRAEEILNFVTGNGSQSSDLSMRLTIYGESIQSFIDSPLIGSFGGESVGGHSSWLDMLGGFGLLSGFCFAFLFLYIKKEVRFCSDKARALIITAWSYYISLGFINTVIFASMIMKLFFILPLAVIIFDDAYKRNIIRKKTAAEGKTKRVLWTTNVIMPYPAERIGRKPSVFGGWLIGLMKQIVNRGDYKLAIAAVYDGSKIKRFNDGKIVYYLLPCKDDTKYNGDLEYYWSEVVADFQPDLIHLHGTELVHNLVLQNACPNEKYLVSLQGLLGPISKKYLAGLSKKEIRRNRTFRDRIKGGILKNQKNNKKRSFYEAKILKNATAIVGRTEWDHNESLKIAGNKPYYKCNEILRDAFYDQNWNIREVEPHSIYVSQAGYPVKGFHILLEALPKLVEKYPDLKVYVAGPNILDRSTFRKRLLYSGYAKILENKIKKYGLEKNVIFIGEKTEAEVLEYMKKSNVFVQCSVIENSSNSLGEAMLIGMPCVASDVGGTTDLLDVTRGEGLLYRFGDARTLAELISRVFDDFGLAAELGENAKKHAKIIYDRQKNTDTMLEIYKKVINS